MARITAVNIRPGVNVLAILPHLNYKPWYALAEFVDNAIQSSLDNQRELKKADGENYRLNVEIFFDREENSIVVRDNAAGIAELDYRRAFRPAEIPPDASGLSEFGMGMKSAACWFAPDWTVRTSALGEAIERTIIFDINQIVEDSTEELSIVSSHAAADKHYTEIRLDNLRRFPHGNTIQKIKSHLSSIYRAYIRDNSLFLTVDGEPLSFSDPDILVSPCYRDPNGPEIVWKKDIRIDLGDSKSAEGFVAIRSRASTKFAGLALFRRKRLIMGSFDETYRPEDIFGRSNDFRFQRIFGEIHLKGFHVSHTKDGIKWDEAEVTFLNQLRNMLDDSAFPLLQQAQRYRTRKDVKTPELRKSAALAAGSLAEQLNTKTLSINTLTGNETTGTAQHTKQSLNEPLHQLPENDRERVLFRVRFRDEDWDVSLELSYEEGDVADWLEIHNKPSITDPEPRQITIRIFMLHPFMTQFPTLDSDGFRIVQSIAAAIALAEVAASEVNDGQPHTIRRFINEVLRNQMSRRGVDD